MHLIVPIHKSGDPLNPGNYRTIMIGHTLAKLYGGVLEAELSSYAEREGLGALGQTASEFNAKPQVMVLGQYSTGKTSFIKHLLRKEYPGAYIGPEPTTDRFVAVMEGAEERIIPGNAAVVQADLPFSGLSRFGSSFLSKFECAHMPNSLLKHISFIDTPGVLSGEKQRTNRSYDFPGVTEWFAAKCDLIILVFDPYKLDISDEFRDVIKSLHGHDSKIRLLLNKADCVDAQQLMRVHGALMWSLGKVFDTPEVMRVYIGSFLDEALHKRASGDFAKQLFEKEQDDLLDDLCSLPKKACDRRVNEFVKRAQSAKLHALIIGHLKSRMPYLFGKSKKQEDLVQNLKSEFLQIQEKHRIPAGDFPNVDRFRKVLATYDISSFARLKPRLIKEVDDMLANEIPALLQNFKEAGTGKELPTLQEMKSSTKGPEVPL
ncbi:hypothetical protein L7F22_062262 [Adiantum nelumboides]|nr:hypothetical protein [Adiantum nelumboides]